MNNHTITYRLRSQKQKLNKYNMKTLFAFLGLFMFASVSSIDIAEKNIANEESQLMDTGEYSTSPSKKADLVARKSIADTGEYSTSPSKKADLVARKSIADTGEYSTSPSKKADLVARKSIADTGEYSTSPSKKADLVARKPIA
jgi:hypothetical protein